MSFFGTRPAVTVEPKDVEVPNLPTDSVSAVAFSPTADILAVASWSNEVRLYEVNAQGQAVGKAAYSHEGPVLDVCWSKVGSLAPCRQSRRFSPGRTITDEQNGIAAPRVGTPISSMPD